jgi:hypothetical protein
MDGSRLNEKLILVFFRSSLNFVLKYKIFGMVDAKIKQIDSVRWFATRQIFVLGFLLVDWLFFQHLVFNRKINSYKPLIFRHNPANFRVFFASEKVCWLVKSLW